jgi:peptidoglycan/xylan/chitin deacetylase (PgdA/CDA1 family)
LEKRNFEPSQPGRSADCKYVVVSIDDGYENALTIGEPIFQRHLIRPVLFPITGVIGEVFEGSRMLNQSQLYTLYKKGWEMGSHSFSHPHHDTQGMREAASELSKSFKRLRSLGFDVSAYSYPFGETRQETLIAALANAGYFFARSRREKTDNLESQVSVEKRMLQGSFGAKRALTPIPETHTILSTIDSMPSGNLLTIALHGFIDDNNRDRRLTRDFPSPWGPIFQTEGEKAQVGDWLEAKDLDFLLSQLASRRSSDQVQILQYRDLRRMIQSMGPLATPLKRSHYSPYQAIRSFASWAVGKNGRTSSHR